MEEKYRVFKIILKNESTKSLELFYKESNNDFNNNNLYYLEVIYLDKQENQLTKRYKLVKNQYYKVLRFFDYNINNNNTIYISNIDCYYPVFSVDIIF